MALRDPAGFFARQFQRFPVDQRQQPIRAWQSEIFAGYRTTYDDDRNSGWSILDRNPGDLMEYRGAARFLKVVQHQHRRLTQTIEQFTKETARKTLDIGQVFRGQQGKRSQVARPARSGALCDP